MCRSHPRGLNSQTRPRIDRRVDLRRRHRYYRKTPDSSVTDEIEMVE